MGKNLYTKLSNDKNAKLINIKVKIKHLGWFEQTKI